jgi:hypothetical protein
MLDLKLLRRGQVKVCDQAWTRVSDLPANRGPIYPIGAPSEISTPAQRRSGDCHPFRTLRPLRLWRLVSGKPASLALS